MADRGNLVKAVTHKLMMRHLKKHRDVLEAHAAKGPLFAAAVEQHLQRVYADEEL